MFGRKNNTITYNGKTISYSGSGDVSIINGQLIIDGNIIEDSIQASQVVINGDVGDIKTDLSVNVTGNVKGNIEAGGAVNCNSVKGSISSVGSVNCDDVGGDVSAGESVNCDDISGDVTAGGSVRHG